MLLSTFALIAVLASNAWAGRDGPFLDDGAPMSRPDTADTSIPESRPDQPDNSPIETAMPTCTAGVLTTGVQLPNLPRIFNRYDPNHDWGTQEMIDVLVDAAQEMAWLLPDADPIFVGDMTRQHGGPLGTHKMHQNGLDADIGLYTGDHNQPLRDFADVPPPRLDAEATWLLIRSLLATDRVQFILLDPGLIDRLRTYLLTNDVLPRADVDRIFPPVTTPNMWQLNGVVWPAADHRNHMHVHVMCANPS